MFEAQAARPNVIDESELPGAREGHLVEIFTAAGLDDIQASTVDASREHATFEEWWQPYTGGVGPAGVYLASLPADQRDVLRERCRARLPEAPFTIIARAWAARGIA